LGYYEVFSFFSRLDFLEVLSGYMWNCAISDSTLPYVYPRFLKVWEMVENHQIHVCQIACRSHCQWNWNPAELKICFSSLLCNMGKWERQSSSNPQKKYKSSILDTKLYSDHKSKIMKEEFEVNQISCDACVFLPLGVKEITL